MKKQLLAFALVAGVGASTWSDVPRGAVDPTGQVGLVVGLVVHGANLLPVMFDVYRGMRFGFRAGSNLCRNLPFQEACAEVGMGVGMR